MKKLDMKKYGSFFTNIVHRLKKYSTTLTTATEGSNSKSDLSIKIKNIINRLNNKDDACVFVNNNITNKELNDLSEFYFNKSIPSINTELFIDKKLNLSSYRLVDVIVKLTNDKNDIDDINLVFKEETFNTDLMLIVSINNFDSIFKNEEI